MLQNRIKKTFALLLSCLIAILSGITAYGEASKEEENYASYSVKAVDSELQIDKALSYFYLKVTPGKQEKLEVMVINKSDQEQTFTVRVNNAGTNRNGVVTYEKENEEVFRETNASIQSITKVKSENVTIAAHSSQNVVINLTIPQEPFQGILLGGIEVRMKGAEEEASSKGMAVKNTYGYVIGLLLTEDESYPTQGLTDIELSKLVPQVEDGRKVVTAFIRNKNSQVFGEFTLNGKINKKGDSDVLVEEKLKNARIAPNTELPFQLDWGMSNVEPGVYVFKGTAKGVEDPAKVWNFEEEFTISAKQAKKMNKETVFKVLIPQWFILCFVLLVMTSGLLLLFLSLRLRRSKEAIKLNRDKRRKKKSKKE